MSNWIFWGYNGCVETWCTGMQQSGFDRASNQLSSPRGEQIAVWMMFNHLADRLHLDSSLRKGSVWDVDVPRRFSSASGLWSFWVGAMGEHFLSVLSPFFQCIIFHVSTVKSLFWWKACDLCVLLRYHSGASASNTDLKGSRWTYSLSHMSLMMQHRQYSVILITDFVHIGQTDTLIVFSGWFFNSFRFVFQ